MNPAMEEDIEMWGRNIPHIIKKINKSSINYIKVYGKILYDMRNCLKCSHCNRYERDGYLMILVFMYVNPLEITLIYTGESIYTGETYVGVPSILCGARKCAGKSIHQENLLPVHFLGESNFLEELKIGEIIHE